MFFLLFSPVSAALPKVGEPTSQQATLSSNNQSISGCPYPNFTLKLDCSCIFCNPLMRKLFLNRRMVEYKSNCPKLENEESSRVFYWVVLRFYLPRQGTSLPHLARRNKPLIQRTFPFRDPRQQHLRTLSAYRPRILLQRACRAIFIRSKMIIIHAAQLNILRHGVSQFFQRIAQANACDIIQTKEGGRGLFSRHYGMQLNRINLCGVRFSYIFSSFFS